MSRIAVALGGNALLERGDSPDIATQRLNAARAARALAPLAEQGELVVTHGNGPQVGLLALQAEGAPEVPPYPLDVLGAQTEGLIGYLLTQSLRAALPGREIATLLTQVEVDARDPAFARPTKPIGPVYERAREAELAARGFAFAPDGSGLRRVVPSPLPRRILELATIRRLLDASVLVICAGGGGIPVVAKPGGELEGCEAVVDKDRTAALLAAGVGAAKLLLLTDVPAVYVDWPDRSRPLAETTPRELESLSFDPGSMGPKVEAACAFVAETGGVAAIGALEDAPRLAAGRAGTRVRASRS